MRENVERGHPHREAASGAERPSGRGAGSVHRAETTGKNAEADGPAPLSAEFLLGFFKALLDPARLRLAGALAEGAATPSELSAALALPLAQVVKQLAQLEQAEIVRRNGDRWALDADGLRARAKAALPTPRSDDLHGATDERSRVLASLMRNGRLLTWPAGDARKLILLEEIVRHFAPDRVYSEREVNDVLAAFYDDYTTLRRALVDYHLMNRDHGAYWRGAAGQ